jgi:hypothetical protein
MAKWIIKSNANRKTRQWMDSDGEGRVGNGGRRVNGDDRRDHGGLTHLKRRREAWIHGAGCFQVPGVAVRQQINYRLQPQ